MISRGIQPDQQTYHCSFKSHLFKSHSQHGWHAERADHLLNELMLIVQQKNTTTTTTANASSSNTTTTTDKNTNNLTNHCDNNEDEDSGDDLFSSYLPHHAMWMNCVTSSWSKSLSPQHVKKAEAWFTRVIQL